jgi:hypothetical protein
MCGMLLDGNDIIPCLRESVLKFGGVGKEGSAQSDECFVNVKFCSGSGGDSQVGVRLGVEESVGVLVEILARDIAAGQKLVEFGKKL